MMKRSIIVYQLVCSYFDANRESCVALLILHLNISRVSERKSDTEQCDSKKHDYNCFQAMF